MYLYRFRFLTSTHIQHLLNDKTLRLTNYHLKILTEQNYINKHYNRSLGQANQPAVYFLASGSIKALQDSEKLNAQSIKRIYREKTRSQQFITHAVFIAEYYLFLLRESQKTKHTLHFFTKTDLQAHPYILHPLPDAYFARVDEKKETKRYFVEVIDEGTPRFAIRKRIEQYNNYIDNGTFEEVTKHPFPTILLICPTLGIQIYFKKYLAKMFEETSLDQVSMYLTTQQGAFLGNWEKVETEEE
ncbi:MAG: replication-relaxation family protein [Candidatus Gottesmanbacteria bacterium]